MRLNIQLFASGSFYLAKGTGDANWKSLQGRIDWESVPNTDTNTSTVTTKLYGRTWTGGTSGRKWRVEVKVGSNTSHIITDMGAAWADKWISDTYTLFATFTDTVTHNEDGTLSIPIYGSLRGPSGSSIASVYSTGTSTVTLDNIPRASTFTFSDVVSKPLNGTLFVYTTKQSSTFKTKIEMTVMDTVKGTSRLYNTYITDQTTYQLNIDPDIVSLFPNTRISDLGVKLRCYTLDANNIQVTDNYTDSRTFNIEDEDPDNPFSPDYSYLNPTISLGTPTDISNKVPSSWGILLGGISRLSVPVNGSAKYGASISYYSTVLDTMGTFMTYNASSGNMVIDIYEGYNETLNFRAYDSRGRGSDPATINVNIEPYSNPTLTTFEAKKVNTSYQPDENGTLVMFSVGGTIASCGGHNTKMLGVSFDEGQNYISLGSDDVTNMILTSETINPNVSNTIKLRIIDGLGNTDIRDVILDAAFRLVNINPSKTAIAVGKKSRITNEDNLLEIGMPTEIKNNLSVEGNTTISETLSTSGNISSSGSISASGSVTCANVISNNLFDKNYRRRNTAYRIETLNTGIRVYYGNTTGVKWTNSGVYLKNVQDLLGKTFTLSSRIVPSGNNNGYIAISEVSFDGVHQRYIAETATGNVTFTFPSSLTSASNQICVNFYSNFNSENAQPYDYVDYLDVKLEEGETATPYTPYLNLEEVMKPTQFMRVSANQDQLLENSNYLYVNFNNVEYSNTDYFKLVNGRIKNVSGKSLYVKVSTNLWVERALNTYSWCHLMIGGDDKCNYMIARPPANGEYWSSATLIGIGILHDQEEINPYIYFQNQDVINSVRGGSYPGSVALNVEVLE